MVIYFGNDIINYIKFLGERMDLFMFLKKRLLFLLFILIFFSMLFMKACISKRNGRNNKLKVELKMDFNNVKKVVLDNGFTILIFKNIQTPKVLLQIAYDVGSWVEKSGERGLAHLIEHMIFKGTEKLSEGDIDSIARKYGASFNAFTSKDMTSYYFETDKNNWEPFVGILADCMQNARFDSQHLASEFKAVIQELHMRKDNYLTVMFDQAAKSIFPSNHPYHNDVIGYKEDIVNITAEKLKEFYKKYYSPERATLFVVGDVDEEKIISLASESFKNLSNNKSHDFTKDQEGMFELIPSTSTSDIKIYEDVKTERLGFYWLIPGLKARIKELACVVESIIGSGEGSRLYKRLVEKEKVASIVLASSYQFMGAGLFFIVVEPLKDKSQECKKFIVEEIEEIIKNGVENGELAKVVKNKEREHFQSMQDFSEFAYEWIESYFATKDENDVFESVNRYANITSENVVDFVKEFLDPFFINQVSLLPLPENKKSSWLKLKEQSEKLDAAILDRHKRTTQVEEPKFFFKLSDPKKLDFEFPKPDKEVVLDNGLTVIMHQNEPWPIFSAQCKFKQASFLSSSKEGIVLNFMMNYLMEGTDGLSKDENVDFFENHGVSYGFDVSGGSVAALSKDLDVVLNKFVQILMMPDFPTHSLKKLRDIFLNLYARKNDSQKDKAIRCIKNIVYKDHPYSWTFEQALEIIKDIDIKKLKELHKKYVTPKNMILSIAGSFDVDKVDAIVKKNFGSWSGGEYLEVEPVSGDFVPGINVDEFMLRDQVLLLLGRASDVNLYHKDYVPLRILDFISFNSLGSRLYQLREQTGLFYVAFGGFAAKATRVNGFDYVGSILNLENVEKTEKLFMDVIDQIGKGGVHEDELAASRQNYLKELIDLTSSNETLAAIYTLLKSFDLGFDYYDKVLNQVQNMSLQGLNTVCSKYYNSKNFARVRVGRVGKEK